MLKILKSIRNSFLISVLIIFNVSAKDIRLSKDVGSGNTYTKSLQKGFKKYGYEIVNKKDGHPVRAGDKSIRFELRNGDCGEDPGKWSDCESLRQRHELSGKRFRGKSWYAYSIYLPKDFKSVDPVKSAMAQFQQKGSWPTLMFQLNDDGYFADRQWQNQTDEYRKLLEVNDMKGKWNDILVNAKWTHKKDGFFKIWINGKLAFHHKGRTQEKGERIEFHFGIYRSFMSRTPGPDPTQIAYYDEIRHAKSCKKLKLKELGYSCKEIEIQK